MFKAPVLVRANAAPVRIGGVYPLVEFFRAGLQTVKGEVRDLNTQANEQQQTLASIHTAIARLTELAEAQTVIAATQQTELAALRQIITQQQTPAAPLTLPQNPRQTEQPLLQHAASPNAGCQPAHTTHCHQPYPKHCLQPVRRDKPR